MRILMVAAGAIGGDFGARCPPPDATLCSGAAAPRCKAGEDRTGRQKPKRPSCLAATAYRGNRAIRVPFGPGGGDGVLRPRGRAVVQTHDGLAVWTLTSSIDGPIPPVGMVEDCVSPPTSVVGTEPCS